MTDTKNRMLNDKFKLLYEDALSLMKQKKNSQAVQQLNSAIFTLLKLAQNSTGDLKKNRTKRANELMDLVKELEKKTDSSYTKNTSAQADYAKYSKKANKDSSTTDQEEVSFKPVEKSNLKLDDVAGLESVKNEIRTKIIQPQKFPEVYKKYKKKAGGGILLYGVPGTGKTMIAKAIANEIDAKFFSIKCSDIASKWFGDSEKKVKELFQEARSHKSSIIFFDEFEALGAKRDSFSTVMKRLVPELLAQMQGFEEHDGILIVIAATNRPWDLDSAFLRPGRFDTRIHVGLPDEEARKAIITNKLEGIKLAPDFDINHAVKTTEGFNGADVADSFCEKLKDYAIDRTIKNGYDSEITMKDLEHTATIVRSSVQESDLKKMADYEKKSLS